MTFDSEAKKKWEPVPTKTNKMAAGKSIVQELVEFTALQTQRRLPAYLSPSDAVSKNILDQSLLTIMS